MTDKAIIKALECLEGCALYCRDCSYSQGNFFPICQQRVAKDALDLINRQQEQLEAAIAGQETLQKALAKKDREVERLNNNISAMAVTMRNCAKATRAEAIKQFAERLKQRCSANSDINYYILKKLVDNLVKEMVGNAE